ncbi:MAG: hypothetical protein PG981_001494 [Wolbachia endosymbiont of Ctenocephalides orientis wCori]|nr:MAG: hypothetical protein PG981_001494 [Wolbachia endosymbiont of Ctenocephalides orientis wCori]
MNKVYEPSADYIVDSDTSVIKRVENSSIVESNIVALEYTQSTPPETIASAKLLNELGRCVIDEVLFCTGDENGELITPTGRFKPSNVPTNNLYLKTTFDFTDAANQVIRELGVMVGTKVKEELPPGQRYFEPQELVDHGIYWYLRTLFHL